MKLLQYIRAMFKKNAKLAHDALAIHLHNKVSRFEPGVRVLSTCRLILSFSPDVKPHH